MSKAGKRMHGLLLSIQKLIALGMLRMEDRIVLSNEHLLIIFLFHYSIKKQQICVQMIRPTFKKPDQIF